MSVSSALPSRQPTVTVGLTNRELVIAAEVGAIRNIESISRMRQKAWGFPDDEPAWNVNIEGVCGEIAIARYLGIYWSPSVNTFHAADVGLDIQVRTRLKPDYDLIVRPDDDTNHYYVLVTGPAPTMVIRGYILGHEAQCHDEWRKAYGDRPEVWFVPQSALSPIGELLRG